MEDGNSANLCTSTQNIPTLPKTQMKKKNVYIYSYKILYLFFRCYIWCMINIVKFDCVWLCSVCIRKRT